MAQKLIAPLPRDFDIGGGFVVQLTAVDPATGADVTAVKVSGVAIMASPRVAAATVDQGPDYAPLFLPVPSEPPATVQEEPAP